MSIDASSFAAGARREAPQEPPAREKLDLKPSRIKCGYCGTWADMDQAAKQKYKCVSCGGPFEVKAERARDDDEDFGAMMRRMLKEREGHRVRMF